MVTKRKTRISSIPVAIVFGLLISLVITLLMAVFSAYLLNTEQITEEGISICAIATQTLSAATGSCFAAASHKGKRVQICLLTGLCYYLVLLSVTALFLDGEYSNLLSSALAIFIGSGTVAIMGAINKKGKKHRVRKMAYR